jgi:hypothetical protein
MSYKTLAYFFIISLYRTAVVGIFKLFTIWKIGKDLDFNSTMFRGVPIGCVWEEEGEGGRGRRQPIFLENLEKNLLVN